MSTIRDEKGFSIIEVVVVLAIFIIVYSIIVPDFMRIKDTMTVKSDIQSARVMTNAIKLYESETGDKISKAVTKSDEISTFLATNGYIEEKSKATKPQIGTSYELKNDMVVVKFENNLSFTEKRLSVEEKEYADFGAATTPIE